VLQRVAANAYDVACRVSVTVCCSVLQRVAANAYDATCRVSVTVCCSVLQRVAANAYDVTCATRISSTCDRTHPYFIKQRMSLSHSTCDLLIEANVIGLCMYMPSHVWQDIHM